MNPINDAAGTTPLVAVSLPLPSLIRAMVIALRAVGVQIVEGIFFNFVLVKYEDLIHSRFRGSTCSFGSS